MIALRKLISCLTYKNRKISKNHLKLEMCLETMEYREIFSERISKLDFMRDLFVVVITDQIFGIRLEVFYWSARAQIEAAQSGRKRIFR